MALFPTWWELLLPNFNVTTLVGILMIIIGIIILKSFIPISDKARWMLRIGWLMILGGIVSIWAFSIVEDLFMSAGGKFVIGGSAFVIVVLIILFYDPKKKK